MAQTRTEIEKSIHDLKEGIASGLIPQDLLDSLQDDLKDLEAELDALDAQEAAALPPATPYIGTSEDAVSSILATLKAYMAANEGSGMDSAQIRQMIEQYFSSKKISLGDLDKEVIDEIKKNQMVVLQIPALGLKIDIDGNKGAIPNLRSIIDDVLAGNNVYLIGEAGGGKTFTAETVANILKRERTTINCSQYTSPAEIVGGQTITGYQEGKLIDAWKNGKVLILDEMPRLDPNTAGLFNDALAKSSHTKTPEEAKISSTNPKEGLIERNNDFALIATGNVYPNTKPPEQYKANNQQDLSLLDRFSGSVYYTAYSKTLDEKMCRFQFLYDMLVGNYYEWTEATKKGNRIEPKGLRTVLKANNLDELAVVSYRTLTAFRVSFEFELVRAIGKKQGLTVSEDGKTLVKAFNSFMVAFGDAAKQTIIKATSFTDKFIQMEVDSVIKKITDTPDGFIQSLTPDLKNTAASVQARYQDLMVAEYVPIKE
jgi:hypothetical protein